MCSGLPVPGMAQVTAGWLTIHLRKYCAQLAMPSSAAQGGSGLPFVRRKRAPSAKGRLMITATFFSFARGNNLFSAWRSPSE